MDNQLSLFGFEEPTPNKETIAEAEGEIAATPEKTESTKEEVAESLSEEEADSVEKSSYTTPEMEKIVDEIPAIMDGDVVENKLANSDLFGGQKEMNGEMTPDAVAPISTEEKSGDKPIEIVTEIPVTHSVELAEEPSLFAASESTPETMIEDAIEVPSVSYELTDKPLVTENEIATDEALSAAPTFDIHWDDESLTVNKRGRKSFKEIDADVDLVQIPKDDELFQKQYYSISEVANWFHVNNSLLRFWENEFDILKPRKNRKGDRLFRPEDVKNLQVIYYLLRQKKYTIDGARKYLKNNRKTIDTNIRLMQTLKEFRTFLLELRVQTEA